MGLYLNPGNETFAEIVANDIYVDKSGLIAYLNGCIGKAKHMIASSRPRRFGKTLAAQMLTAYYSKGCDSRAVFRNLEISQDESFEEHLNKYNVIRLDIQWMRGIAIRKIQRGENITILGYMEDEILRELKQEFSNYVPETQNSVAAALAEIYTATKQQFVIIIDEWDCVFREDKDNEALQKNYINFLRGLFKGDASDGFVKLAYITGILPIKKYKKQSALNNFRELTMIAPGKIARYIGFTEKEVKALCKNSGMPFKEMQKWYDGYYLNKTGHVYSPDSVMEAIANEEFRNYWSQTETYEDLKLYIEMDFDGLRQKVVTMLGGGRCKIVTQSFQNDMTSFKSASDVLTLLVHLGYLAYDSKTSEVFIPNEEVRDTFVLSMMDGDWGDVYHAIQNSEKLLSATLAMDENTVAKMIQNVHMENSSSLVYNNEISLSSIIQVAYYTATRDYTLIREFPAGEGFADMVFIPKRRSKKPALAVELKWDKSAEGAVAQIKDKKYVSALKEYKGNLLLVGINYDKKSKEHQCRIERYEM